MNDRIKKNCDREKLAISNACPKLKQPKNGILSFKYVYLECFPPFQTGNNCYNQRIFREIMFRIFLDFSALKNSGNSVNTKSIHFGVF